MGDDGGAPIAAGRDPAPVSDATLRLAMAPGIGPATLRRLRDYFGGDEAVVAADRAAFGTVPQIGARLARALVTAIRDADPAAERRRLAAGGAVVIGRTDRRYPPCLAAIPGTPELLWVRGTLDADARPTVAIVGSRRCSAYGRAQAGRFAERLAAAGLSIISGGARGIDAAAHRGALRAGGHTVVVLGHGLEQVYPPEHVGLFDEIVATGGAIVSEFPMAVPPRPAHFPRRNRVISGWSAGTVVVEAGARSGALVTARVALEEHGREVMVLPGRVDEPRAAGSLALLRDGGAALVLEPEDVLAELGLDRPAAPRQARRHVRPVSDDARAVIAMVPSGGTSTATEAIVDRLGWPVARVCAALTELELAGRVRREHDGWRGG